MTNRKKALTDLLAKVEAGEWLPGLAQRAFGGVQTYHYAADAFNGSLDAAKALHEAVLPGWFWYRQGFVMTVTDDHTGWGSKPHFSARDDDNPARAWLIAILKALIAQEDEA